MEIDRLILAIALVFICGWILFKKSGTARQSPQGNVPSAFVLPATKAAARKTGSVTSQSRELPEDLSSFKLRSVNDLGSEERVVLLDLSRNIPGPPRSLYELTSAEFMTGASSTDISQLVLKAALVALQVMENSHSLTFGLSQPVKLLAQAITFLGASHVSRRRLRKPGAFVAACSATAGRPGPGGSRDRPDVHGGMESVTILGGARCGDRSRRYFRRGRWPACTA